MFTVEFGVPQSEANAILDYAFSHGINFADTAEMYGFGEGEELLGRALRRCRRKKIIVSTKIGYPDRTVSRNQGDAACRNEDALRRMIDHSFWLLQRDFIDILMIHEPNNENWWQLDRKTGDAAVTRVLEDYKKRGQIGAIGLGLSEDVRLGGAKLELHRIRRELGGVGVGDSQAHFAGAPRAHAGAHQQYQRRKSHRFCPPIQAGLVELPLR